MATRKDGKKLEEFQAEQMREADKTYKETAERINESAEQKITEQNQVIDSSAAVLKNQYQDRIDEVPKKFAGDFDGHLIDELVARKNLENTMADLGMTDSGLNRSQQAAISVMRGNADAETRRQQRDYITAAEQAIDQVLAQAETDKATYANSVNAQKRDQLDQLRTTVDQNAATNAVNLYNAQEESLDNQYAAQLDAENKLIEQNNKLTSQIITYAQKRVQDDPSMTMDRALLEGKILYGVATEEDELGYEGRQLGYSGGALDAYVKAGGGEKGDEAAYNVSATQAAELVSYKKLKIARIGWESAEKLGEKVFDEVNEKLAEDQNYAKLGEVAQSFTASYAIAKCVAESCEGMTEDKVLEVLYFACENMKIADYKTAEEYLRSVWQPSNLGSAFTAVRRH